MLSIKFPSEHGTKIIGFSVFFILFLFSVLTILSAIGTYRISIMGSLNLLRTRATDIALTITFALERIGNKREILEEMLANSSGWDNVAFISLYDKNSVIALHSNPNLIGSTDKDPYIKKAILEKHVSTHYEVLQTGEKVFVLDFPATLRIFNEPDLYCLRVALHIYPAQSIVRKADFQLLLICLAITLLWLGTIFFLRFWRKVTLLQEELKEKEKMAALGEMAAVLAHEIRNPLSSIKGFSQVYLELSDSEEERADFAIIVGEATRLERLTTNLLFYAKPLSITPVYFSVYEFTETLKRECSLMEPYGNINIALEADDKRIYLDKEALKQIILNLIQNALDAAQNKELPTINVTIKDKDGILEIKVKDNGDGIKQVNINKIFDPFFTTKTKGTGLGLSIVKRLIDMMDGQIKFLSKEKKGTTVIVRLPYEA